MQSPEGPFLATAVLCEKVLREADGAFSAIRVFDRLTVTAASGQPMSVDVPRPPMHFFLWISFRAGAARGKASIGVKIERPDGIVRDVGLGAPILFEGEERAANVVVELHVTFELDGLYWFQVVLDEELITKIPLRIVTLVQQLPLVQPEDSGKPW